MYECRRCPAALLGPCVQFLHQIAVPAAAKQQMDAQAQQALVHTLFPKYTPYIMEIIEQAIQSDSVEIAHGCVQVLRQWMWCAAGGNAQQSLMLRSFVPLLLKDTVVESPEEGQQADAAEQPIVDIGRQERQAADDPDLEMVNRYLIRLLARLFDGVGRRGSEADQFVMYLDAVNIIKGLVVRAVERPHSTLTW